ncbi:MAG: BON domain-containing protein, partial [Alphaproteobacteria bacterium]|nr:BON domain-containing protein [Alphaproteobacteria bacterium]
SYAVDIELTVFEGAVLLNGALPNEHYIDEVARTVWQTNGVQKVYNYIRLDNPPSINVVNEDAVVSAKIRYQLSITRGVSSVNYKITMENGIVYLMGISENQAELDSVIAVIKNTVNVKDIIVLTRFKTASEK